MATTRRVAIVIQARMGSQRLPGKVLRPLGGRPLIAWCIARATRARLASEVVCALPDTRADDELAEACAFAGASVVRGSELDVLARYVNACDQARATDVVRITGDCPLIDPRVIDRHIERHIELDSDLTYNVVDEPAAFPRGMDVEVVKAAALRIAAASAVAQPHREHVTPYVYENPARFALARVDPLPGEARGDLRLCVDREADLMLVREVVAGFPDRDDFTLSEIIAFLDRHPEIVQWNDALKAPQDHVSG